MASRATAKYIGHPCAVPDRRSWAALWDVFGGATRTFVQAEGGGAARAGEKEAKDCGGETKERAATAWASGHHYCIQDCSKTGHCTKVTILTDKVYFRKNKTFKISVILNIRVSKCQWLCESDKRRRKWDRSCRRRSAWMRESWPWRRLWRWSSRRYRRGRKLKNPK